MHLSVIIPAYNEENRLPKTVDSIHQYLSKQSYDYEIIVVNDGSRDKTAEIVQGLKSQIANLKLIDNKENHGKGYVVRQGMLQAQGDFRVFTDADNATSIDQIEKMRPEFSGQGGFAVGGENGFEVVIGSRDIKGAVIAVPQPGWRIFLGNIFNLLVQFVSGLLGIWDTQCGFKGFTAKAAQDIFSRATINRWAFDVEVLVIAKKLGYKIKEIPIIWINDPESKVKFSGMIKMLWEVVKIRWNLINHKYDLKSKIQSSNAKSNSKSK